MTDFSYGAARKLKQKREIDVLFQKGKWQTCGNVRVITLNLTDKPQEDFNCENPKVGVSVSKRLHKRAVDRNRIKRLLRECYRLNKDEFSARFGENSLSMLFWVSKEKPAGLETVMRDFQKLCVPK